jgi:urea carboxylase-associated protein 2
MFDITLPGGWSWAGVLPRGSALTLTDLRGGANVSALLYRASDHLERYCMPDTLKAQHISRLTAGSALYSDMGRVLASITADSCGWHDTITGHATAEIVEEKWGSLNFQVARNAWHRSARDGLLTELAKFGLGQRDLVANINFFTKIAIGEGGELSYAEGNSPAGSTVTVRFELDTLVVLANVPHPLDPSDSWAPGDVQLTAESVPAPGEDDPVRTACPENVRGFLANEAVLV